MYRFELRRAMKETQLLREGAYPSLVAARWDAICEAKNLLAEGVLDGGIEIRDAGGHLVSKLLLRDVQEPLRAAR